MKNGLKTSLAAMICLLALGACDSARETLGMNRTAPDEFAVVQRAPLEYPPNYQLQPPSPGAARPQEIGAARQAETTLFGEAAPRSGDIRSGESALLQAAGAEIATPDIRQTIDRETAAIGPRERPVAERLLGWTRRGGDQPPPADIVDAEAEAARLRDNIEAGKPVTTGNTPSVKD